VHLNDLKKVWTVYAEQSKDNISHYHLLNREFEFNGTLITLPLTNPIEEPLLDTIKAQLITFLREQLGNSTISVVGVVKEMNSKRVAYTNKEKFDHLAEKNPMLLELRDRLGLDVDF
jgi:DNA polymerase-3 subunit gamma/tau